MSAACCNLASFLDGPDIPIRPTAETGRKKVLIALRARDKRARKYQASVLHVHAPLTGSSIVLLIEQICGDTDTDTDTILLPTIPAKYSVSAAQHSRLKITSRDG